MQSRSPRYEEAELSYLILDFLREKETRDCLRSIKAHTKFNHKIIYLHNGDDPSYPYALFKEGLIDHFIQTKENNGLGIGTRDLFAASFSPWSFYLQNDQKLIRDFTQEEFDNIKDLFTQKFQSPDDGSIWSVKSVCLAGGFAGLHTYSERAHIIQTRFYKEIESSGALGFHGAGPCWHNGQWREEQMQKLYTQNHFLHFTYASPLVEDRGRRAIRQNRDGSIWEHNTGTQELRLIRGPICEKAKYPPFSDTEWEEVLATQSWTEWKRPGRNQKEIL